MSAELLARCRAALAASDETAKAANLGDWSADQSGRIIEFAHPDWLDLVADVPRPRAAHIAANDPATRLALNAALTVVLDGIEATLTDHAEGRWVSNDMPACHARRNGRRAWVSVGSRARPPTARRVAVVATPAIAASTGTTGTPTAT